MEAAAAVATPSSLLPLFSTPPRSSLLSFPSSPLPPPCKSFSCAKQQQQQRLHRELSVSCSRSRSRSRLSLRCSSGAGGNPAPAASVRWILEPSGDGDWRHIGYRVARPGAFEIASDAVTVGRVDDKADIVLPVATVSGVHARLEKKDDGSLVVTDLDSTNGTYINERRLSPGIAVAIDPGSLLIFGDIHLAMFRVSKIVVEVPSDADAAQQEIAKAQVSSASQETD